MILPRAYSHHSLLSAVPKIPTLIESAKQAGYSTVALTDEDTGSGFVEFYDECKKADIKGTLGVVLRVSNISSEQSGFGKNKQFSKIALLAKNSSGYKDIIQLITIARTKRQSPQPHILYSDLQQTLNNRNDVFVIICGREHEVVKLIENKNISLADTVIDKYKEICNSSSILIEFCERRTSDDVESDAVNNRIVDFAQKHSLRPVFSPAPRYINKDDEESFRTVLAIRDGKKLSEVTMVRDFDLKPVEYYKEAYPHLSSYIETQDIEDEINLDLRFDYDKYASEAFFPVFELEQGENSKDRLRWETYIGLITNFHPKKLSRLDWKIKYPYKDISPLIEECHRLEPNSSYIVGYPDTYWTNDSITRYIERIEYELDIISNKGYSDYFLVFADIMQFGRDKQIVINTRGSAAGSLVGYLTNINILDPLLYQLPFERFLNPFRPSPPDIDGDFADDRREEIIEYIYKKYGSDRVCQIITFGAMLPRAAVRDVGRVLGISYKKCDRISKLIPTAPQGKKTTFSWAFSTSEELTKVYAIDEECKRIIDIARKIEGNFRHASVHAAGVIVAPKDISQIAPLQYDSENKMIICQYDMRNAEKAGLIKFDILGIRNLAILGNSIKIAQDRHKITIDLLRIDIQSQKAFDLLAKGRTMGTFQLSGPAMTRYLIQMVPTKVNDLMAMVALYRPGPMASIPDYIERKKKPNKITYLVPQMEEWMKESYGIFVYQEDVLFTAINLAGYDWGGADTIRKGLGKKIQSVIDEQHPKFVQGCVSHSGISEEKAEEIWSLIVPFAAYGFNKAHSSSYGMVAYWTAYMKANYTVEFMTAYMTAESNNLDKIATAINECKELGIKTLPPDVNISDDTFTIEDDTTIRYGLSSIKNLGSDVIKFMIKDRIKNGVFGSMDNFLERMAGFSGFNKKSLEALIWSGSLDSLMEETMSQV